MLILWVTLAMSITTQFKSESTLRAHFSEMGKMWIADKCSVGESESRERTMDKQQTVWGF